MRPSAIDRAADPTCSRHAGMWPAPSCAASSAHARALTWALTRPLALAAVCGALVVATCFAYNALGSDLLPEMDEGAFVLDYIMPAGSSLHETNRILLHVDRILHSTPKSPSPRAAPACKWDSPLLQKPTPATSPSALQTNRSRGIDDIMEDARERIKAEPELDIEFTQVLQDMIGDLSNSPEPVQIKLFSTDPPCSTSSARGSETPSRRSPAWSTRRTASTTPSPAPPPSSRSIPALPPASASPPVKSPTTPPPSSMVCPRRADDPERPPLHRPRPPPTTPRFARRHPEHRLQLSSGHTASLGSLAQVTQLPPQNEILRENLQQMITVTGRLEGSDLGSAMQRSGHRPGLHIPSSVRVEYGGTYQEQQQSSATCYTFCSSRWRWSSACCWRSSATSPRPSPSLSAPCSPSPAWSWRC